MEDLKEAKNSKDGLYRYRKLDEYSQVLENYGELILDMNSVKIM
jgi:hypothetical protein